MSRFRQLLPEASADAIIAAVLDAVRRAYSAAGDRFDPDIGCDGHTFGTDVWRFTWHEIEREAQYISGAVPIKARSSFALRIGCIEMRFYRGGFDDNFNVHTFHFTGSETKRAIPRHNFDQLKLSLTDKGAGRDLSLTVVHTGNPELLCTGVSVGLAVQDSGGSKWQWIERLDEEAVIEANEPTTDYSDMPVPEPEVILLEDDPDDIDIEILQSEEDNEAGTGESPA